MHAFTPVSAEHWKTLTPRCYQWLLSSCHEQHRSIIIVTSPSHARRGCASQLDVNICSICSVFSSFFLFYYRCRFWCFFLCTEAWRHFYLPWIELVLAETHMYSNSIWFNLASHDFYKYERAQPETCYSQKQYLKRPLMINSWETFSRKNVIRRTNARQC